MDATVIAAVLEVLLVPIDVRWVSGPGRRIYCYRQADGRVPALEFLDLLPAVDRARYATMFEMHAQGGQLRGEKHHVWNGHDSLAAYKSVAGKSRLVHTFESGNRVVLLFGFSGKKEDKIDQVHVNEALRLRDDFRSRRDLLIQRTPSLVRAAHTRGTK